MKSRINWATKMKTIHELAGTVPAKQIAERVDVCYESLRAKCASVGISLRIGANPSALRQNPDQPVTLSLPLDSLWYIPRVKQHGPYMGYFTP